MDTFQTIEDYASCRSFAECIDFTWERRPQVMLMHGQQINHKYEIPYYIFIIDVINMFEEDLSFMKKMNSNINKYIKKTRMKTLKKMR